MKEKYDRIGIDYNETRKADPYILGRLTAKLLPIPEGRYLDVGCGTGNYTTALAAGLYSFIGLDPSERMLSIAREKNAAIDWRSGRAEAIPLADATMDGVVASLTIHHWPDLLQGFSEVRRVLKPGGRLVLFTSTAEQMLGYWLNAYFPKMLADSIRQMPQETAILEALKTAGLEMLDKEAYFVQDDLEDLFLYAGKNRPHLYLDPQVRKGISSFSDLANQLEVQQGLQCLEEDLKTGKLAAVICQYSNDAGDYCFLTTIK
ncbi:MAG: class I SAM-dependent methyltransferase [Phaeodactylibacter sp.]|nr:class I SAM-dependent methyltransferase [Phaeodactylibacter sp.]